MILVVLNVLPINVMAESGSGSPILRSPSSPEIHGNVVKTHSIGDGCKFTLYEDGYTLIDKRDDVTSCSIETREQMPYVIRAKVKKLDFTNNVTLVFSHSTFFNATMPNVTEIDLSNIKKASEIVDSNMGALRSMFSSSSFSKLEKVNFGDKLKDIKNVNNISNMFNKCKNLKTVIGFEYLQLKENTVVDASYCFSNCVSLSDIRFPYNFGRHTFARSNYMFYRCSSMPSEILDNIFSFKTNNGVAFSPTSKYYNTEASFQIANVKNPVIDVLSYVDGGSLNGERMFAYSTAETVRIDKLVPPDNTNFIINFNNAFFVCKNLETVNIPNIGKLFEVERATNDDFKATIISMFNGTKLKSIDVGGNTFVNIYPEKPTLSALDNITTLQTIKISSADYADYDKLNLSDELFKTSQMYTGRWLLKYDDSGNNYTTVDVATNQDEMFKNKSGRTGYWIRETTVESNILPNGARLYESDDNKWIRNPDGSMTYKFKVVDDSKTHYVLEDDMFGYTRIDQTKQGVLGKYSETKDKTATVVNKTGNVFDDRYFNLTIKKQIDGIDGTTFPFEVTLTTDTGDLADGYFGTTLFVNGKAIIGVKGNQEKTINNIPKGYKYSIKELTPDGYELLNSDNTDGTVTQSIVSTFTNKRKEDNPAVEHQLVLSKNVTGVDKEFGKTLEWEMSAIFTNLNGNKEYSFIDSKGVEHKFTTDSTGTGVSGTFTLSSKDPVTFKFDTKFNYKFTEKLHDNDKADIKPSYKITRPNGSIVDNNSGDINKDLVTGVNTFYDEDKEVSVEITNNVKFFSNLTISKNVVVGDKQQKFNFKVTIKGLKYGDVVKTNTMGNIVGSGTGKDEVEFTLKHGETVKLSKIPSYATYTVGEVNNNYGYLGAINVDGNTNTLGEHINDDITTTVLSPLDNTGNPIDHKVEFINAKQSKFSIKKIVVGNMGNKDEKFRFRIKFTKADGTDLNLASSDIHFVNGSKNEKLTSSKPTNNEFEIEVGHGEVGEIQGLDIRESEYKVEVEELNSDKYFTKMSDSGKLLSETDGKKHTSTIKTEEDGQVVVTNSRDTFIPTGITMGKIGIALVLIGASIVTVLIIKKKKD